MLRIKKSVYPLLLAVLLCISVTAQAQQDLIDISQLSEGQISYRTTQVQTGNLEKTAAVMGKAYYPLGVDVCFAEKGAKFVQYTVSVGDSVKAGDVLMYYTTQSSEVELTRLQLSLSRAQEAFAAGLRSRQEQITRTRAEISAEKDSYEKEKKTISLRILEIELERYRYEQERSILSQKEAIENLKERQETGALLAPADGVVETLTDKDEEEALADGERLVCLRTQEVMLIEIDNASGSFRYNMPVSVSIGSGTQAAELTGRVTAAETGIDKAYQTGKAYVQLDSYDKIQSRQMRNIKVSGVTLKVENVLIAPQSAVSTDRGKYFVNCLQDGAVRRRYVQTVMSSGSDVWILSGVSEGDTLVLN